MNRTESVWKLEHMEINIGRAANGLSGFQLKILDSPVYITCPQICFVLTSLEGPAEVRQ